MESIVLPSHVKTVLDRLESRGFEAWCVGGCVRDSLLHRAPTDWDVTTAALPEEIKVCFEGFRVLDVGIKHGTVTVLLDGQSVEVTTYRSDGAYADHRHPDGVRFSRELRDDLSRRDFTVNAMAYHPERGLRDEFGGEADLRAGVLRCVGDPNRRFEEDALRILRCLRFSAALGFSIADETARALREKRGLLPCLSHERVREELTKLLCGKSAANVLREFSAVLFTVLPELAPMAGCGQENPYHQFNVWEHTLRVLDACPQEPVPRWAALLHDCGKPAVKSVDETGTAHFYGHEKVSAGLAGEILERLRFSNRERETVLDLVRLHGELHPIPEKRLKKLLGKYGEEQVLRLCGLSEADLSGQASWLYSRRIGSIRETEKLLTEILERKDCLTLRGLAANGNDLLEMGYEKGPSLGKALQILLDEVLAGKLPNQREALLGRAEELRRG